MLNKLQDLPMTTTDFLLYRDFILTFEQNKVVLEAVQELNQESRQFSLFYISHMFTPSL